MVTFEPNWLMLAQTLVYMILPLVVALVTTRMTPGNVKAVLLLALSAVTSFATELVEFFTAGAQGTYDLFGATLMTLVGFVFAVATHFGVWRAENRAGRSITTSLQDVDLTGGRHRKDEPPSPTA